MPLRTLTLSGGGAQGDLGVMTVQLPIGLLLQDGRCRGCQVVLRQLLLSLLLLSLVQSRLMSRRHVGARWLLIVADVRSSSVRASRSAAMPSRLTAVVLREEAQARLMEQLCVVAVVP